MKQINKYLLSSLATALVAVNTATAQVNLLVNASFEDIVASSGALKQHNSGWTGSGGFAGEWAGTATFTGGWLENNENLTNITTAAHLDHFGLYISNSAGTVTQSVSTVIGQSYTISGLLGNAESNSNLAGNGATAAVLVGGVAVATQSEGQWGSFTHTFTAAATTTAIAYGATVGDDSPNPSVFVVVDNLNLTKVPEPSSAVLLGLGVLGLIVRRKRA